MARARVRSIFPRRMERSDGSRRRHELPGRLPRPADRPRNTRGDRRPSPRTARPLAPDARHVRRRLAPELAGARREAARRLDAAAGLRSRRRHPRRGSVLLELEPPGMAPFRRHGLVCDAFRSAAGAAGRAHVPADRRSQLRNARLSQRALSRPASWRLDTLLRRTHPSARARHEPAPDRRRQPSQSRPSSRRSISTGSTMAGCIGRSNSCGCPPSSSARRA